MYMRLLFIATIIFICNNRPVYSQSSSTSSNQIVVGKIDSIQSTILKENRKFWVYVPNSGFYAKKNYPVVYLLDGNSHFYSTMGMIHQLSSVNGNTVAPEMIIVGIPNTDRTRDLTPTHVQAMYGDSNFTRTSGGLNHFNDFIEKELMPYVDAHYPTTSYKTFIGHSFGGLAVIYTLLTRPHLYNNYVAIDPSLLWDNSLVLRMADSIFTKKATEKKSLYLAIANTLQDGMEPEQALKDTGMMTEHYRAMMAFVKSTENLKPAGLNFGWKYYSDEDHGSVPFIAGYDALRFLFPWYKFNFQKLEKFIFPGSTATADELVKLFNDHYQKITDHFGYPVHPDESMINGMGYQFMMNNKLDLAFACFDMNVKNYSGSANVYDSMGDYYMARENTDKAIEFFTKSLKVQETPVTRRKLDALLASNPGH